MLMNCKTMAGDTCVLGTARGFAWDGGKLSIDVAQFVDVLDILAALDPQQGGIFEVRVRPKGGNGKSSGAAAAPVLNLVLVPTSTSESQAPVEVGEVEPPPASSAPAPATPASVPPTGTVDVLALCRLNTFGPAIAEFKKAGLTTFADMVAAAEGVASQVPMFLTNQDWKDRLQVAAVQAGVEGAI